MTRPHIEFIQSQVLPWRAGLAGRPGVDAKTLSRDGASGAATVLLRYPAGWRRDGPEHVTADEELFVLDGALTIGGVEYSRHCYANFPAGYVRQSMASEHGAHVLTFFSADPAVRPGRPDRPMDERHLVQHIAVPDVGRLGNEDHSRLGSPEFDPAGLGMKILRENPDTGEVTWIMGCEGVWLEASRGGHHRERHPTVEEIYVLAGAMGGNCGTLYPGAYFWRPPDIWHGPYGVREGFVHLNRCHGGPFSTTFSDEPCAVEFDAPYEPVLPSDLRVHVGPRHGPYEWPF